MLVAVMVVARVMGKAPPRAHQLRLRLRRRLQTATACRARREARVVGMPPPTPSAVHTLGFARRPAETAIAAQTVTEIMTGRNVDVERVTR